MLLYPFFLCQKYDLVASYSNSPQRIYVNNLTAHKANNALKGAPFSSYLHTQNFCSLLLAWTVEIHKTHLHSTCRGKIYYLCTWARGWKSEHMNDCVHKVVWAQVVAWTWFWGHPNVNLHCSCRVAPVSNWCTRDSAAESGLLFWGISLSGFTFSSVLKA